MEILFENTCIKTPKAMRETFPPLYRTRTLVVWLLGCLFLLALSSYGAYLHFSAPYEKSWSFWISPICLSLYSLSPLIRQENVCRRLRKQSEAERTSVLRFSADSLEFITSQQTSTLHYGQFTKEPLNK